MKMMKLLKISFTIIAIISLSGCDLDRKITAGADLDGRTGYFRYGITPAAVKGQGRLSADVEIKGSISDGKQVIEVGTR